MNKDSGVKVSVIIPVYNVKLYFDRCMESVINQTLKELEIILIDDGSTDGSSDICDKWALADSRVKVIHKANEGQSKARNVGIELANGEYIAFVDSDDYISLETYETLYRECILKELDVAYFCFDRFDSDGRTWVNSYLKEKEMYFGNQQVMSYFLNLVGRIPSEYNQFHYTTSASMALYRNSLVQKHSLFFKDVRKIASEDLILNIELIPHTQRIGVFPYCFYHYYDNDHSTTTTYSEEKYNRLIECLRCVEDICMKYFSYQEYSSHYYSQLLRIFKVIMRYESVNKTSMFKKCRRIKSICCHPLLDKMYIDPVVKGFSLENRLYIWCMRHSIALFFVILYAFKKKN